MIGIDPGLADTGIGIVRGTGMDVHDFAYGVIKTHPKSPLPARLETIYTKLGEILLNEQPGLMIVEAVFSAPAFPQSGITLGKVCGVILLAGSRAGIPIQEIPVREAKQVLTGNGNAGKTQLEQAVRRVLNIRKKISPNHASDALALALIGLFRY